MGAKIPSIETLLSEALEILTAEGRAAYLDRACGGDEELRRQVESLLEAHARAGGFLVSPAAMATGAWDATPGAEGPGTCIGPYKLMEPIGEGGMGVVYVAEQRAPVRRKVALKVIKPGMDTRQVIARFEAERQALALMDHPNIAKVHDGGRTDTGLPYFVMELVPGVPITEYCDGERLSIRDRLELFVLVCRAVQHAHQKGIIHRDLKPSNILVTLHDGVPVPKVIDFGVAKATGQSLTEKTIYTAFTQIVGTPLYMSPEQVELSGLDIDTRSDIYSLGVLLYELLTGTTPFDSEALRQAAFDEMRRIIREEEPPRPSTRLSTLGASLTTTSAKRSSDPRHLDRSVRGELDWIAMKALEKDRRRRYETANDFAADVMRYLTDEPVEACPPSAWYRLRKSARRNRIALTTAVLVAGALLLGLVASVLMAIRAADAERRTAKALDQARDGLAEADRQRARARKAVDEMYTQIAQKWLSREGGLTPLQRDFLEKAQAFYDEFARERADDPEARREAAKAAVRVGEIRSQLGQSAGALESHQKALDTFRRLVAEYPGRPEYLRDVARSLRDVGTLHESLGRTRDAEQAFREALALQERLAKNPGTPADGADLAASLGDLGRLLNSTGRAGDAERTLLRSIDLLTKLVDEFPKEARYRNTLNRVETNLGIVYSTAGRHTEAEASFRRALSLRRELADADPADAEGQRILAMGYHNLGSQFSAVYRHEEAAEEYRRALPIEEKLAAEHPERPGNRALLAKTLSALSRPLILLGHFDEAEKALSRAREIGDGLAKDFPDMPEHRARLASISQELGAILADRGRDREARDALERAHEIQRRLTEDFPDLSLYRHNLAAICYTACVNYATLTGHDQRDAERAREFAREAIKLEPEEAGYWKALALAEYRAGDFDAALRAEKKRLELGKDDGYSYDWMLLALIHLGRGDREQARVWAERCYRDLARGFSIAEPDFMRLARETETRLRALLPDHPELRVPERKRLPMTGPAKSAETKNDGRP